MYLKRIELEGFKSFADRTVVPLQRGLTGIVGAQWLRQVKRR